MEILLFVVLGTIVLVIVAFWLGLTIAGLIFVLPVAALAYLLTLAGLPVWLAAILGLIAFVAATDWWRERRKTRPE